jgi:hypothetical protein
LSDAHPYAPSSLADRIPLCFRPLLFGRLPQVLVATIHAAPESLRKIAGWVLVSLAVDPELGEVLAGKGALPGLIAHAKIKEERMREEAAWALANLSSLPVNATPMGEKSVVDALMMMLREQRSTCSETPTVSMQVVWTLANLAVHDQLKCNLAEWGVIEELLLQLNFWMNLDAADKIDDHYAESLHLTLHQAMRGIANLAAAPANRQRVGGGEGIKTILRAEVHPTGKLNTLKEVSTRTLVHLMKEYNLVDQFVQAGGIRLLIDNMVHCACARVQGEAIHAALNISIRQGHSLVCDDFLAALMTMLDPSRDPVIQERSARVLFNLSAGGMQHKMTIVKCGALRHLNRIMSESKSAEAKLASNEVMHELGSMLTPTSRRALVGASMMPPAHLDSIKTRAARRRRGSAGDGQQTRRSSPLATIPARAVLNASDV